MSFWDTSAVVPLCINEIRSLAAGRHWKRYADRRVWCETTVEIASAFSRLVREQAINQSILVKAERRLKGLEKNWIVIDSAFRIIELARTFPKLYQLKAGDSLQLAAALVWCKEFPKNKDFVSGDVGLLKAAENVGFTIHDIS